MARTVLGVDGWKKGWAAVGLCDGRVEQVESYPTLHDLVADNPDSVSIVVDIPIGLPIDAPKRLADVEAKRVLGKRASSVFFAPCMAALEATTYQEARRVSVERVGVSVSSQAYRGLRSKIMEAWPIALSDARIVEGHPEVSFAALSGAPMGHHKRTWNGQAQRRAALESVGITIPAPLNGVVGDVPVDDVFDAAVMAWTADRLAQGLGRFITRSTRGSRRLPDGDLVLMTITFQRRTYARIGPEMQVAETLVERPDGWDSGRRLIEEPIETLLGLDLERICGVPIAWVRWAWPMHPWVDIVGVDPLGRFHLFELKKGPIGRQSASQLEQYLLGQVFSDPRRFLAECDPPHRAQLKPHRLAVRIAGARVNERTSNFGSKAVRRILGDDHPDAIAPDGRPLTKSRWIRLGREEQSRRKHTALATVGAMSGIDFSWEGSRALATRQADRLAARRAEAVPLFGMQRPAVFWLVGRSIQSGALEHVRMWRRAGIDARVLRLEIRLAGMEWLARWEREDAPQRDRFEGELATLSDGDCDAPLLRLNLYDEVPASTARSKGGALLESPFAEYVDPDGSRHRL